MLETILTVLAAVGCTGVTMAVVLKHFLEKSIEKAISHRYDKLLETHKVENLLLSKRYDSSIAACQELHALVAEINTDIADLQPKQGQAFLETLLSEFHPKYRRQFQFIRARFEASNDIFSSYSLQLDTLTHPDVLREFAALLDKQSPSNLRRMYRKVWVTVSESLTSLVRVCADARYWEPNKNYGARADAWAAHDCDRIRAFLIQCVSPETKDIPNIFYLSLEEDDGMDRFWKELPLPTTTSNPSIKPTATGKPVSAA